MEFNKYARVPNEIAEELPRKYRRAKRHDAPIKTAHLYRVGRFFCENGR